MIGFVFSKLVYNFNDKQYQIVEANNERNILAHMDATSPYQIGKILKTS